MLSSKPSTSTAPRGPIWASQTPHEARSQGLGSPFYRTGDLPGKESELPTRGIPGRTGIPGFKTKILWLPATPCPRQLGGHKGNQLVLAWGKITLGAELGDAFPLPLCQPSASPPGFLPTRGWPSLSAHTLTTSLGQEVSLCALLLKLPCLSWPCQKKIPYRHALEAQSHET